MAAPKAWTTKGLASCFTEELDLLQSRASPQGRRGLFFGMHILMAHDQSLREHLLSLLAAKEAHLDFDAAVADLPLAMQGARPKGLPHSPWELLEHLRIAQWDILEFSRNPKHVSPDWPSGYWPANPAPPDEAAWDKSVAAFRADLAAMKKLVSDLRTDLYARIPHGEKQTVLREALLLADHSAYHLGQLVLVRQLLGAWK
jgi:hypothetical protein